LLLLIGNSILSQSKFYDSGSIVLKLLQGNIFGYLSVEIVSIDWRVTTGFFDV